MPNLYNNGYVVMGLQKNSFSSTLDGFRGVDSFVSWPLKDYNDSLSKSLEDEAWDKWFGFKDVLEVVPQKDYLIRYVNHCKDNKLDTIILQLETPNCNQIAIVQLDVLEVLGFDCITGVQLSYLNLLPDFLQEHFPVAYVKLNSNGLCDSIDDAYKYLETYNKLLSQGIDLEHGPNPVPAKLSIVKL